MFSISTKKHYKKVIYIYRYNKYEALVQPENKLVSALQNARDDNSKAIGCQEMPGISNQWIISSKKGSKAIRKKILHCLLPKN